MRRKAETVGKPTPRPNRKQGTQFVQPATRKTTRAVKRDCYGVEIPPNINAELFGTPPRRFFDIFFSFGDCKLQCKEKLHKSDPYFAAAPCDEIVSLLHKTQGLLLSAKPHCVCRMCRGKGCKACGNRGWQTHDEYERTPQEFKADNPKA